MSSTHTTGSHGHNSHAHGSHAHAKDSHAHDSHPHAAHAEGSKAPASPAHASHAPKDAGSTNAKLIVPFMNAVREVFEKMAGVKTTVDKPHLKTDAHATYEVCGIIGFSGQISGSVVLCFTYGAAEKLVEAFAGVHLKHTDPDFADAVGELANMIAGSAKQHLGALASISVPSVVIGKGYTITCMRDIPCLVIPCNSPYGAFAVEVSIKSNATK